MLTFIILSMGFADYWEYSKAYHLTPSIYMDVLQGSANAPAQYRIGVLKVADFLARHAHVGLRHTLTLIDVIAAFVAVFTLFSLLRRSDVYKSAGNAARWFGVGSFVILVQFYFAWVTWYQRPETLPTAALVSLVLLLLTDRLPLPAAVGYVVSAAAMVLLAVAQGFTRADVAFAIHAGILLVCLTSFGNRFALPRGVQIGTSLISILVAFGIQSYLMHVVYPLANYGSTPVVQFFINLTSPMEILAFLLFMLPYGWTVNVLLRRQAQAEASAGALLCGSAIYLGLWFVLGRIAEVRIFLPFALAVAPLTAQVAMQRFIAE